MKIDDSRFVLTQIMTWTIHNIINICMKYSMYNIFKDKYFLITTNILLKAHGTDIFDNI